MGETNVLCLLTQTITSKVKFGEVPWYVRLGCCQFLSHTPSVAPACAKTVAPCDVHCGEEQQVWRHASDLPVPARGTHCLHRVRDQLFVQKRTWIKDYCPGAFDPVTGGVVAGDESYEVSATRELEEELGIEGPQLKMLFTFPYHPGHVRVVVGRWCCTRGLVRVVCLTCFTGVGWNV